MRARGFSKQFTVHSSLIAIIVTASTRKLVALCTACIGCTRKISQMPVVLIPVHFDRDTAPIQTNREPSVQRSIVLRPFVTNDFMTGEAAIPGQHLPLDVRVQYYSHFTVLYCMYSYSVCAGCGADGS